MRMMCMPHAERMGNCRVVSLLQCCAVLSRSWAVSERSESLCCWRASLFLSLSYWRLSSFKRLLHVPLDAFSGLASSSLSVPSSSAPRGARTGWYPVRTLHTHKHNFRLSPISARRARTIMCLTLRRGIWQ